MIVAGLDKPLLSFRPLGGRPAVIADAPGGGLPSSPPGGRRARRGYWSKRVGQPHVWVDLSSGGDIAEGGTPGAFTRSGFGSTLLDFVFGLTVGYSLTGAALSAGRGALTVLGIHRRIRRNIENRAMRIGDITGTLLHIRGREKPRSAEAPQVESEPYSFAQFQHPRHFSQSAYKYAPIGASVAGVGSAVAPGIGGGMLSGVGIMPDVIRYQATIAEIEAIFEIYRRQQGRYPMGPPVMEDLLGS